MLRLVRLFGLGLVIYLGLSVQALSAPSTFLYGVGTHFPSNPDVVGEGMRLMQEAGFNSYRDDIYWHIVEKQPGLFNYPGFYEQPVMQAQAAGISPMLILGRMGGGYKWQDGGSHKPVSEEKRKAFSRYAAAVASHYRGRVSLFELWNEWDQAEEPKTLEPYLALLKEVAPGLRVANPEARLLLGSSSLEGLERTWIPKLLDAGVNDLVDGYSIHPYVHCEGRSKATPEWWFDWVSATLTRLNTLADGKIKPFYITEMSWPAHQGACGISERQQAIYLAKIFVLAPFIPHVKGLWWYDLQNDGVDRSNMEHNFGLLTNDLQSKDAYRVAQSLVPALVDKVAVRLVRLDSLWIAVLSDLEGRQLLAVWQERNDTRQLLRLDASVKGVAYLVLPGGGWVADGKRNYSIGKEPLILKGRSLSFEIFEGGRLLRKFGRE